MKHESITWTEMSLKSFDELKQKCNLVAVPKMMYVNKNGYSHLSNVFPFGNKTLGKRNGAGVWLSVPVKSGLSQYDISGTVTIVNTNLNQPPLTGDRIFGIVNFIFHTSVEANNQFEEHNNQNMKMKYIMLECKKYINKKWKRQYNPNNIDIYNDNSDQTKFRHFKNFKCQTAH